MTGSGAVLAAGDAAELERRSEALLVEMNPRGELASHLVRRVALMTVKLDRCSQHEARAIAYRMRRATAEFDDARLAEVEKAYSWLAHEPATHARRLRAMPEGIDKLVESLQGLKSDLGHEDGVRWGWQHCEQLHHLLGRRRLELPVSRARALSEAVQGHFQYLARADGADLSAFDRQCWAATELVRLIGGEVEALKVARESLDLEGLELDRSEAPQRAIFDASKEATLARKYEAAAERGLFRTLREYREVQAETPPPKPEPGEPGEPEIAEELGSSLPEPPEGEIGEEDVDETAPEAPPEAVTPALGAPEIDPKAEWIDDR
jgi:hypothetical protein